MFAASLLICPLLYAACGAGSLDHDEYRILARNDLERYGVASDTGSLLRAVEEDERPHVRVMAADLLANLREPRAAALLRTKLSKESAETVRAHLGRDLLELEGSSAHDLARSTLDGLKGLEARMWLAWGLAERGDLVGYPDVLAGLGSASSRTRSLAAQDLVAFVKACKACDLKPQPVDVALGPLENPAASVRLSAVTAVAVRLDDDPRCGPALEKTASTDEAQIVRGAAATFRESWLRKKRGGTGGSQ